MQSLPAVPASLLPGRLAAAVGAGLVAAARPFLAEKERWPLWLPAMLGTGIGLYFLLLVEPPLWVGPVAAALAGLAVLLLRRRPGARLGAEILLLVAGGFVLAQLQARLVAAPVLERQLGPVGVLGEVLEVDPLPEGGRRIVLRPIEIDRLAKERHPARIRVKLGRGGDPILPGDRVRTRAILYPPPGPAMPGAYDFQRRAWFDRLGAVGYAVAAARVEPAAEGDGPSRWRVAVSALRTAMTDRIMAALPGRNGGIAAAIITGETHAIPERDAQAFRDAGLAHILVIAGLHMGMVAGLAFGGMRALLALVPWLALRVPTKKWAALFALAVTFFYMLLSGATVSSRRSFVMTGLALLAVLVDRLPLSARGLAYAATAILVVSPESLTGPSFQMSFAAVAALISFYEASRSRLSAWRRAAGPVGRALLYGFGICLTTVVCTVATAPYTIFHFNRFAVFSVVANVIAVPITGFWVMPWAMVACFLMPFGLEWAPLQAMSWGIDRIAWIALEVTAWPGAVVVWPAMPLWGLMLVTWGGLWLCIWQRRWRLWGVAPVAAGMLSILADRPPDLLVSPDAALVAVRGADGAYIMQGKPQRMAVETWTRRGATEPGQPFPVAGTSADGSVECMATGCRYTARGRVVALPREARTLLADCAGADLVVLREPSRRRCPNGTPIIDRLDAEWRGAHAVWLSADAIRVESIEAWRGIRPWTPRWRRLNSGG